MLISNTFRYSNSERFIFDNIYLTIDNYFVEERLIIYRHEIFSISSYVKIKNHRVLTRKNVFKYLSTMKEERVFSKKKRRRRKLSLRMIERKAK